MYTVKQLSDLAGVSVRTLHYYDEIDLLHPSQVGANGYRYYDEAALLRLQQVLFYREIGIELLQIRDILDAPGFDLLDALRSHRQVLQEKLSHLQALVGTVDATIDDLTKGEANMSKKRYFEGFTPEKQEEYTRSARLQYGPELVDESVRRWNSYTEAQRESIKNEQVDGLLDFAAAIDAGLDPQSAEIHLLVEKWHERLRYFYEPTLEVLRGLGDLYNTDPGFLSNFQKIHSKLPEYMQAAIAGYVDELETAEITRLLAEDEASAH